MTDLAENITKVILDVLKRGGDNYNIHVAVKAALAATPAVGGEPVAWRWRPRGATNWIYDPTPEWRLEHQDGIEHQPLYADPAQSPPEQPATGREKPDPAWVAWLKPATDLYGPKDQT